MSVTVRYFAGAQAAAGREEDVLDLDAAQPLREVLQLIRHRHPQLAPVLQASSYLVNEVSADSESLIPPGATLDVLPPFAGG